MRCWRCVCVAFYGFCRSLTDSLSIFLCLLEPLLVVVEFVNSLQVPIQLNEITLNCSFNLHTVVLSNDLLSNEERVAIKELEETIITNPGPEIVSIEKISQISMNASEKLLVSCSFSSVLFFTKTKTNKQTNKKQQLHPFIV